MTKPPYTLSLGLALSLSLPQALDAASLQAHLHKPHTALAKARVKRGLYNPQATRWPDNIVYYSLTNANPETRSAFLSAARAISDASALRFIERTTEARYLLVANSMLFDSCGFAAGEANGPQFLLLNPMHCYAPDEAVGTLLHELMHALGAEHEHQRDDRIGQVVGGSEQATRIQAQMTKHGPFDADSIMLYQPGIFKLPDDHPARPWPRNTLSAGDIKMLQTLYPVSSNQPTTPRPTLTNHGITNKISRRIAPVRENETNSITIVYPPGIRIARPTIHLYQVDTDQTHYTSTNKNQAPLKLTGLQVTPRAQDSMVKIDYQALPTDSNHSIMMVIDTPGTDERGQPTTASNLVQIDILANQTWPDLKMGALLSGYSIATGVKQCLTMRGRDENQHSFLNHPEFLGLGQDNAALFSAMFLRADPSLPVSLTPCDSEKLGQQWIYHASSGQITDANQNYYLDLSTPMTPSAASRSSFTLRAHRIANEKITSALWQARGQRFIYRPAPGLALSEMAGSTVGLAPTPRSQQAKWQQWIWY